MSFGFLIVFDMGYLAGIFGPLGILIPRYGKTVFTYPRIGYIQFKQRRKRNISLILLGVMILGVVLFFFLMGGKDNSITDFLKKNMLVVIAAIWGGALALAGIILDVKRFMIFGALVFVFILAANWVGSLGLNLISVGILLIFIGLYTLYRFIKKYPVIENEES